MTLAVYMGHDRREQLAYDVACSSLRRRTKAEVDIKPIGLDVPGILSRPVERRAGKLWCPISNAPMATEFAISRFCVPFLQRGGWALFVDCDVVFLADVADLFALADPRYAVMCVKHEQMAGETMKMDGQEQTYYARKNWSSVVLWNCEHPAHQQLSLAALNNWTGRALHAFRWLADDEIGALPPGWNFLVGVDQGKPEFGPASPSLRLAHYTMGGPWFPAWKGGPLDDLWLTEKEALEGVACSQ